MPPFSSQIPYGGSQLPIIQVPGDLMPFYDLLKHCMYMILRFTCRQNTYIHKKYKIGTGPEDRQHKPHSVVVVHTCDRQLSDCESHCVG